MKSRPFRWPVRNKLALLSMSLLLGAVSLEADAIDKATRDAHAGRVFFPPDQSSETYDSFIVYLKDDAPNDDIASTKALSRLRQLDDTLERAGLELGVTLGYSKRISTGGHLINCTTNQ